MGESVRIVALARDLIQLSGHAVDQILIVFSGMRPGEKLYDERLADADVTLPTRVKRLRIARLYCGGQPVGALLNMADCSSAASDAEVKLQLHEAVLEYELSTTS